MLRAITHTFFSYVDTQLAFGGVGWGGYRKNRKKRTVREEKDI